MTSDEFRKILDRFHEAIGGLNEPANRIMCYRELDEVWRDLNRHCVLMKDAERSTRAMEFRTCQTCKRPFESTLGLPDCGDCTRKKAERPPPSPQKGRDDDR